MSDSSSLNLPDGITIDILIKLIKLCCDSTIFSFNGSFYQQKFGVAMGSPLACILANIFMEFFESELVNRLPLKPAFWRRYVDDIICIWQHDIESFQPFLDGLNRLSPSIKLSVEWEVLDEDLGIAKLPFLDVLIHRSSSSVNFSVYRKPSHCHMYIHYFSHHAPSVKKGVLSSLYLRALRVSSPGFLDAELDTLWVAFKKLGYPDSFIKGALSAAKTKFFSTPAPSSMSTSISSPSTSTPTPTSSSTLPTSPSSTSTTIPSSARKTLIFVPYHPFFVFLKQYLYATEYKLVFTYRVNTRSLLVKRRDSIGGPSQPGGVYRVPCSNADCNMDYYGRTSRPLDVRMGEHVKDIQKKNALNSMFKHMASHPGHEFNFEAAKILWKTRNLVEQKVVEAACISSLPCCNITDGDIHVNPLLASVVMRLSNIPRFISGTHLRTPPPLADFFPPPVLATSIATSSFAVTSTSPHPSLPAPLLTAGPLPPPTSTLASTPTRPATPSQPPPAPTYTASPSVTTSQPVSTPASPIISSSLPSRLTLLRNSRLQGSPVAGRTRYRIWQRNLVPG